MRLLVKKVLFLIPFWISWLPYYLSYQLVRCLIRQDGLKIWYRNSFYFKKIVFGVSDIDLTFVINDQLSSELLSKMLKRYFKLKRFVPILGEINIYHEASAAQFIRIANRLEIRRDPKLHQYFSINKRETSIEEKLIYLSRSLEADAHNLLQSTLMRRKKWDFHARELEINSIDWGKASLGIEYLVSDLFGQLEQSIDHHAHSLIVDYCRALVEGEEGLARFHELNYGTVNYIIYLPVKWIIGEINQKRFDSSLDILSTLSLFEQQLLLESIKWELWGSYTQHIMIPNCTQTSDHLNHLEMVLERLDEVERRDTFKVLRSFIQLLY